MQKQAPYLKKGDRIRIVAPARKIRPAEMAPALKQIEAWGFEPFYTDSLWAEQDQFAGEDAVRIADFQAALDDSDCRAILCARGGYGSVRLIDSLNFEAFANSPKWLIGYSDITVFHLALHNLGWATLHASMPIDFGRNSEKALTSILQAITGEAYEIKADSHPYNKEGQMQGEIVGGNLSMLYSCLGSASSIDTKGKILFIEDLDEYLYHVDRMMCNLKRNGYFEGLKGILIGTLSDMNDNKIPFGEGAEEIVKRHLSDYGIPMAFGVPAGHQADNQSLIFGSEAEIKISEKGTVIRFHHESQSSAGS